MPRLALHLSPAKIQREQSDRSVAFVDVPVV
jgi:hypothetical protein